MPKFEVKHEVGRKGKRIRTRRFSDGGYDHYRIRLKIEGDLDEIEEVQYELHPTFNERFRTTRDRAHGFPLDIWTWGEFELPIVVTFKDGTTKQVSYDLEYSEELPPDDDAYSDESDSSLGGSSS